MQNANTLLHERNMIILDVPQIPHILAPLDEETLEAFDFRFETQHTRRENSFLSLDERIK